MKMTFSEHTYLRENEYYTTKDNDNFRTYIFKEQRILQDMPSYRRCRVTEHAELQENGYKRFSCAKCGCLIMAAKMGLPKCGCQSVAAKVWLLKCGC